MSLPLKVITTSGKEHLTADVVWRCLRLRWCVSHHAIIAGPLSLALLVVRSTRSLQNGATQSPLLENQNSGEMLFDQARWNVVGIVVLNLLNGGSTRSSKPSCLQRSTPNHSLLWPCDPSGSLVAEAQRGTTCCMVSRKARSPKSARTEGAEAC